MSKPLKITGYGRLEWLQGHGGWEASDGKEQDWLGEQVQHPTQGSISSYAVTMTQILLPLLFATTYINNEESNWIKR